MKIKDSAVSFAMGIGAGVIAGALAGIAVGATIVASGFGVTLGGTGAILGFSAVMTAVMTLLVGGLIGTVAAGAAANKVESLLNIKYNPYVAIVGILPAIYLTIAGLMLVTGGYFTDDLGVDDGLPLGPLDDLVGVHEQIAMEEPGFVLTTPFNTAVDNIFLASDDTVFDAGIGADIFAAPKL